MLDGVKLLVEMEFERVLAGWVPRRLGGGLGGRKESGQLRFGGKERPFRKPMCVCVRTCVRACVRVCVSPSVFLHMYNTIGLVIFAVENICGLTY